MQWDIIYQIIDLVKLQRYVTFT